MFLQGGAAAFSGRVQIGDVVVSIDGQPAAMIHPDTIRRWFVGEPGTALVLVLADPHSGQVRFPSSGASSPPPLLALADISIDQILNRFSDFFQ